MKKFSMLMMLTACLILMPTGCSTIAGSTTGTGTGGIGGVTPVSSQQFTAILKTAAKVAVIALASDPKSGVTPDEVIAINTGIDGLTGQFSDLCTLGQIAFNLPQVNGKIKGSTATAILTAFQTICSSSATTTSNTLTVIK